MASKFAIGDKVDQAFSNHAKGTVVAIITDRAGRVPLRCRDVRPPHDTNCKRGQSGRARQSCGLVSSHKGIDLTPNSRESILNRYFGMFVPGIIRR